MHIYYLVTFGNFVLLLSALHDARVELRYGMLTDARISGVGLNPVQVTRHSCVDSGIVGPGASLSPWHYADELAEITIANV